MASVNNSKMFDVNGLSFSDPVKNKMGGNMIYLKYNGGKCVLQTPLMSAPFGMSTFVDEKSGIAKYSIDVSYRGYENNEKINEFKECMHKIDDFLIDTACKKSKIWFGKEQIRDVIEALYRPLVKPSKDPEKYAPTTKIKVQERDGDFQVKAYDYNTKEPFNIMNIGKGAKVQMIIECSPVWFVGKTQFGISWKLVQVRVQQPESLQNLNFVEDSDDDMCD